ncbi:M48 family metalloprotease [Luteibacter sp. dw_328]|uniref:M48 family metalloprotease n=1 Tax=Luteibacter sp. dw_328 TaxID=2719796 RepID=UPI001BD25A1D|nr:M48 family metalloprotease [Luteibacter sp. dw_328]
MVAIQTSVLRVIEGVDDLAVTWNHVVDGVWVVNRMAVVAVLSLILATGWGSRLYGWLGRLFRGWRYPTFVAYGWILLALCLTAQLPGSYFQHANYPGPDPDSFGEWLAGAFGALVPCMLGVGILGWVPFLFMRRSPRRWWLWLGAVSAPVLLALFVVQPVWTSRASELHPLNDGVLAKEIRKLAAQCGLESTEVIVGGSDTHVVGVGGASAIVLQSDLQRLENPAQIRFTIAHELKHYVEGDNWKAWAISVALVLLIGGVYHVFGSVVVRRWGLRRFGFDSISDPRSLPLLAICCLVMWTAVLPVFLVFNRHIEREADRFGLALSGEQPAAIALFRSWHTETEMPETDLIGRLFRANHPPTSERIRMAHDFQALPGDLPAPCGSAHEKLPAR